MIHGNIDKSQLVDQHKRAILYSLEKHQVLIVVGDTGCGKSTRIPQILFEAGIFNRTICITQPRRVAAIQLAQRVSQDLKSELGSIVGYTIRFKDVTDPENTKIKYVTEGILIREMMIDPLLKQYSVIMVDEAHERNLNTDLLIGLLKCVILRRSNLKLIICSATLDIESFHKFFSRRVNESSNIPVVVRITGRTHPIEIFYRKEPVANYLDAAVETVMSIHESVRLASGKILVFLTGLDEVDYVCDKLNDYAETVSSRLELRKLILLPLHASLKASEISQVFEEAPRNSRVCIVSTNVAETSLTIDDVAFVVDCGFVKLKIYDHKTGVDSLVRVPISKDSAKQRAGRAGRTRDGQVYRLYPEAEFSKLEDSTDPEIMRSSLTEIVMLLKSLGVEDCRRFPLVTRMPRQNLASSMDILRALGAIDENERLTGVGQVMANLNLDPKLSKILASPTSSTCNVEICKIVAMLQVKEIYAKTGKRTLWSNQSLINTCALEGDILSYLNFINGFITNQKSQRWAEKRNLNYQALLGAIEVFEKLETQIRRLGIKVMSSKGRIEVIQRSVLSGLFLNAAYLHPSGDYKTVRGDQVVYIHNSSVFSEMIEQPKYVVFGEILNTTKPFMRHLMAVEKDWLLESAPNFFTFQAQM